VTGDGDESAINGTIRDRKINKVECDRILELSSVVYQTVCSERSFNRFKSKLQLICDARSSMTFGKAGIFLNNLRTAITDLPELECAPQLIFTHHIRRRRSRETKKKINALIYLLSGAKLKRGSLLQYIHVYEIV
jgi:hypothetical protein